MKNRKDSWMFSRVILIISLLISLPTWGENPCLQGETAIDLRHLFPKRQNKQQFGSCYLNAANTLACGMNAKINATEPVWFSDPTLAAMILKRDFNPKERSDTLLHRVLMAVDGQIVIDGGTAADALEVLLESKETNVKDALSDQAFARFMPLFSQVVKQYLDQFESRQKNANEKQKFSSVKVDPYVEMMIDIYIKILDFEKVVQAIAPKTTLNFADWKVEVRNFDPKPAVEHISAVGSLLKKSGTGQTRAGAVQERLAELHERCKIGGADVKKALLEVLCSERPVAVEMGLNFFMFKNESDETLGQVADHWPEKMPQHERPFAFPFAGHSWVADGYSPERGFRVINNNVGPQGVGPDHFYIDENELCRVTRLVHLTPSQETAPAIESSGNLNLPGECKDGR